MGRVKQQLLNSFAEVLKSRRKYENPISAGFIASIN
jgi:hypothetical protein